MPCGWLCSAHRRAKDVFINMDPVSDCDRTGRVITIIFPSHAIRYSPLKKTWALLLPKLNSNPSFNYPSPSINDSAATPNHYHHLKASSVQSHRPTNNESSLWNVIRETIQHIKPHPSFQDTTSIPMRRIPRVISHEEILDSHNNHLCTNLLNQTISTPALADQAVMQTKTSSIDRDRR